MTIIAVTGDAATTSTIALAATWPTARATAGDRALLGEPLVVEADPGGGSLAGWLDVPVQPSIATAAAAIGSGEPAPAAGKTVCSRPRGFPMAMTHSPTLSAPELPRGRNGNSRSAASIFSRARSIRGSVPMTSASWLVPSLRVTIRRLLPATTWWLLKRYPSAETKKAEP